MSKEKQEITQKPVPRNLEGAVILGFSTLQPQQLNFALEAYKNLSEEKQEEFVFEVMEELSNTLKEVAQCVGSVLVGLGVKDFKNAKVGANILNEMPKIAKERMLFPKRFDRRFEGLDKFTPMLKKYSHLMPKPNE